jgi:polysaccharide pyruvyl transferase WcaK-like protein
MKKKIGLVGYYGFGNYGDEYFKVVLEGNLRDLELMVLHDVLADGSFSDANMAERIEGVDAILIGGGDLVIPFAFSSLYWRDAYLKRPVFIHGVGVPRWGGYEADVVGKMRKFFQNNSVKGIVARDQESSDWINQHLKPVVPSRCEPDIVCAYGHGVIKPKNKTLGIVLRYQPNGLHNENVAWMLREARRAGYDPKILVLGQAKTARDDLLTISTLDLDSVDILVRDSLEALSDELLKFERVVSMKFHGCVVAMTHDVPCLALSAANKFKNFYRELEKTEWVTSLASADFKQRLTAFLEGPGYEFPQTIRTQARQSLQDLATALSQAEPNPRASLQTPFAGR